MELTALLTCAVLSLGTVTCGTNELSQEQLDKLTPMAERIMTSYGYTSPGSVFILYRRPDGTITHVMNSPTPTRVAPVRVTPIPLTQRPDPKPVPMDLSLLEAR